MAIFIGLWRRFLPPIMGKVLSDTMTNASSLSKINGVDFFSCQKHLIGEKKILFHKCPTQTKIILPPHNISLGMHKQSAVLSRQHNGV